MSYDLTLSNSSGKRFVNFHCRTTSLYDKIRREQIQKCNKNGIFCAVSIAVEHLMTDEKSINHST